MNRSWRKAIQGIVVAIIILVVPTFGNPAILSAPHLWILAVIGIVAAIYQPSYNPFKISLKSQDRGTAAQIIWSIYLTQIAAIIEATYLRYPSSIRWDLLSILSLVIAVAGLGIRSWAYLTLGHFFTWHIEAASGQRVIKEGPYKFVRHPSYLGAFLSYMFIPLFLHSWYSALFSAIALPFAFLRRIAYEEAHLRTELGEEYERYCHSVKRILPGIY